MLSLEPWFAVCPGDCRLMTAGCCRQAQGWRAFPVPGSTLQEKDPTPCSILFQKMLLDTSFPIHTEIKAYAVLILFTLVNPQLQTPYKPALRFGRGASLCQIACCSLGQRPATPRRDGLRARSNELCKASWLGCTSFTI